MFSKGEELYYILLTHLLNYEVIPYESDFFNDDSGYFMTRNKRDCYTLTYELRCKGAYCLAIYEGEGEDTENLLSFLHCEPKEFPRFAFKAKSCVYNGSSTPYLDINNNNSMNAALVRVMKAAGFIDSYHISDELTAVEGFYAERSSIMAICVDPLSLFKPLRSSDALSEDDVSLAIIDCDHGASPAPFVRPVFKTIVKRDAVLTEFENYIRRFVKPAMMEAL